MKFGNMAAGWKRGMYGTPPALNRKTADDRSGRDCAGQVSAVFPDVWPLFCSNWNHFAEQ